MNFLGYEVQSNPSYLFIIKDFLVTTYGNPALVTELTNLFKKKTLENHHFFNEAYEDWSQQFADLKSIWERSPLDKTTLLEFVKKMTIFWPAIYASMYIPGHGFSSSEEELMINLRKKIDIAADEATHAIVKSLKFLYPQAGKYAAYITTEEIIRDMVEPSALEERASRQLILMRDSFISEIEFDAFKKEHSIDLETVHIDEGVKEFKGHIACKGVVKGRARLILKREQVPFLQEGEILISTMTVPDYVPAMKRAAAFVTDEGGITCHAAIIAREMKKPCIIGTKIATTLLKDGDIIEVDAEAGIIRILN